MRIRSIKPEFWRSDDITAIDDWDARLLFIGMWSYVDDNGVGLDRLASIAADLFSGDIESDPRDTFATVSRGLQTLSELGRITRYEVDGKAYLHITNWEKHQRIDKPNKARYPLPTCGNAKPAEVSATPSRQSRETPATGTEEQRNRGTKNTAPAAAVDGAFDAFWAAYPRKVAKPAAKKAWAAAVKAADVPTIMAGLAKQAPVWAKADIQFVPHAATWLKNERWADDVAPAPRRDSRPEGW